MGKSFDSLPPELRTMIEVSPANKKTEIRRVKTFRSTVGNSVRAIAENTAGNSQKMLVFLNEIDSEKIESNEFLSPFDGADFHMRFAHDGIEIQQNSDKLITTIPWDNILNNFYEYMPGIDTPTDPVVKAAITGVLVRIKILSGEDKEEDDNTMSKDVEGMITPELQPCFRRIHELTEQYDVSLFCNQEKLKKANNNVVEAEIRKIQFVHSGVVLEMKKLLEEYRVPLEAYMAQLKEKVPEKKRDGLGFISAFLSLKTDKDDELSFSYMSDEDVSHTLWGITDGARDSSALWRISKVGLGLLPVTSEVQDLVNAYNSFNRGHIRDAGIHLGFFALDAVIDIGALLALPIGGAGIAVEVGGLGVRGAVKKIMATLVKKAIRGVEVERITSIVRGAAYLEKFKQNTKWLLKGYKKKNQPPLLPPNTLIENNAGLPQSISVKIKDLA